MRWKVSVLAVTAIVALGLAVSTAEPASAQTSVETNAVNWAIGQIGNTSYGGLCLTLVQRAYQDGAGLNIEPLTNYGTFNSNTYPQEVWSDGFKSGTSGGSNTTPPYGALVFYNASGPGASDPSDYSHITIMGSGGEMISTNDVVNENAVHFETMAQVASAHPYNTYVGWWLPDGSNSPGGGGGAQSANLLHDGSAENSSSGWQIGPGTGFARYQVGNGAPAIAHDGGYYLAFNGNSGAGASLYQDVPVTAGSWQSYVGTAWISSQAGTATGELCLWGLGPNTHSCISYSAAAGTYRKYQVVYDAPQPVSTIRFQFYPGSGTTDVDTMSLVANLLHDGSAENSSSGWQIGPGTGFARYQVGNGAPAIAHDGGYYLAFNGNSGAGASLYQDVPVTAGSWQSYVGTAWISSQAGTATGELCLWGLGPNTHSCISYSAAAGTYWGFQVVYDAPQPVSTIRFQFYPGSGTTDVDTMSLVANLLHDGSAENSSSGWQIGPGTGFARYQVGNGAPAIAHDGGYYLAFNGNSGAGASLYQDVPVTAGSWQSYVGTAWISSQAGTATGELCLWGLGPNTHSCISYSAAAGTYRDYQVVYDAPQPVSTIRFQFYPGSGTTDVDTMSLG